MTEQATEPSSASAGRTMDYGGLHFDVSFRRPSGATLRVFGDDGGVRRELLRFDDFVDGPHYHVPADGPAQEFDRDLGEPLAWFVAQVRDHLAGLLSSAGFAGLLPELDLQEVSRHADELRAAMEACVPDGYERAPGFGLRRLPT
jgi:hypothetical protein